MQDKINNDLSDNAASAIADLKAAFNPADKVGSSVQSTANPHSSSHPSAPVHRPSQHHNRKRGDEQSNPIYSLLLDPDLTLIEKQHAMAKMLTFSSAQDVSQGYLDDFKQFNLLLQQEHKQVAQKITAISDIDIFSELNSVYDETFTALTSFEAKVKELTDIVDAIHVLRNEGITYDVLREIAKDKEADFNLASKRTAQEQAHESLKHTIKDKTREIALLEQDLTLFGFGVLSRASREKIALLKLDLVEHNEELALLVEQMAQIPTEAVKATQFADYTEQKAKLRELLELSPLQHKARQKAVVNAAQDFIQKSELRINRIAQHMETLSEQIAQLNKANLQMCQFYTIVSEAARNAEKQNKSLYLGLQAAPSLESDDERNERERRMHHLKQHINLLSDSVRYANEVVAELTHLGDSIQSMKANSEAQMARTHQLHNSSKLGIAGLAGQLTSVVQAVSLAALGEASDLARISLEQMQQVTVAISEQAGVRQALLTPKVDKAEPDLSYAFALKEQNEKVELDDALLGSTKGLLERTDSLTKEY
ncbi:hypothetical protein [Motilimonas eburnea]|uniref:hypothetical protein n=1 Tax=Motilimonas eburnea TaxID=1737488 RepID=UPI001E54FB9F|nr:hypothetical protein [Motilimonas eburnea]MCE2571881.1 hypothetical protein [Motilimonas eburnea]